MTQRGVKITEKWCNEVGLTENPNKSEIVIFTKNRELVSFHEPTLFGAKISRKQSAKYLGITMDSRLNWSEHIESRLEKCVRIFWCCRSAIGKTWGLSPKSIM